MSFRPFTFPLPCARPMNTQKRYIFHAGKGPFKCVLGVVGVHFFGHRLGVFACTLLINSETGRHPVLDRKMIPIRTRGNQRHVRTRQSSREWTELPLESKRPWVRSGQFPSAWVHTSRAHRNGTERPWRLSMPLFGI